MKLSILHETTLVGTVAIKPNVLGRQYDLEVIRPNRYTRWYLTFSDNDMIDGLMEATKDSNKSMKTQFGKQTSRPKKLVWQHEENQGKELTNKSLYMPPGTKSAKPYRWPETTFHGQSEGYDEHIIK